MIETTVFGVVLKLISAVFVVISAVGVTRWLDYRTGFDFKEWLKNAPDHSKSVYLGCRIIGALLCFAIIFA